jgi:hypothetical protein
MIRSIVSYFILSTFFFACGTKEVKRPNILFAISDDQSILMQVLMVMRLQKHQILIALPAKAFSLIMHLLPHRAAVHPGHLF